MGLVVGTNSWVTILEADDYLGDKWEASTWAPLTNTQKSQLLITAFWWIYNYSGVNIPKSSTNEKVKNAQIELAWWIYEYYQEYRKREALISSGVKSFSLPEWSETLGKQDLPQNILDILGDELVNSGGYFPKFERELDN